MLRHEALIKLLTAYKPVLEELAVIEQQLNQRFLDMEEQILALILAVASGEPLLFIGPPGTAKSRLIRAFCGTIGLIDENRLGAERDQEEEGYFEYLLTPFTEPGELFGFFDIAKLQHGGELQRQEQGMLQQAEVVFLDEVFNASSALLNSLLSVMNERIFHDRGRRKGVRLRCLFAATNQVPETAELRAFFDRFLLRCRIGSVTGDRPAFPVELHRLLEKGWPETYGSHPRRPRSELLTQLEQLRESVRMLTETGLLVPAWHETLYKNLAYRIYTARDYDLSEMSNRRVIKMVFVMMVHRLYRAAKDGDSSDLSLGKLELDLVHRYFLDRFDEEPISKMARLQGGW